MFNLLLRWRTHKVAIKADIAKMYRQILVSPNHRSYQRIIWRSNPNEKLEDYELQTDTFGTAPIKTIKQLAFDESDLYPIGANILSNDFYVDDLLSGADSVAEAIEKQHQVTQILLRGGFEIRKWSSNHPQVTDQLDMAAREICGTSDPTLKALGILWVPQQDTFSIKAVVPKDDTIFHSLSVHFFPRSRNFSTHSGGSPLQ